MFRIWCHNEVRIDSSQRQQSGRIGRTGLPLPPPRSSSWSLSSAGKAALPVPSWGANLVLQIADFPENFSWSSLQRALQKIQMLGGDNSSGSPSYRPAFSLNWAAGIFLVPRQIPPPHKAQHSNGLSFQCILLWKSSSEKKKRGSITEKTKALLRLQSHSCCKSVRGVFNIAVVPGRFPLKDRPKIYIHST